MKNRTFFLVVILLLTILDFNVSLDAVVIDDLVSYWTFDGDDIKNRVVVDVWGENDAIIKGNPKLVIGYQKHGLKLDGIDDYVILRNTGNFGTQMGPSTFEAWIKTSDKRHWRAIFKRVEHPCNENEEGNGILLNASCDLPETGVHTKKDTILIQRQLKDDDKSCGHGSYRLIKFPIADGNWHHFVFVQGVKTTNKSGRLFTENILYIDSNPLIRMRYPREDNGKVPYNLPVYLGAGNFNGMAHSCFQGIIDEVRIYNRALTSDEVKRNYKPSSELAIDHKYKLSLVWGTLKKQED